MMNKKIKMLIIDDHPLIIEGYKKVIIEEKSINFEIEEANDCKDSYNLLKKAKQHSKAYDIICLDMNLPGFEEEEIYSGEDLGILIKKWFPDTKLMVLTMYSDNFRLYNILKNLEPDGFLVKGDISPTEFNIALKKCLEGYTYYSNSINSLMRSTVTSDFILDKIDRAILFHLSKGIPTKDLPKHIPLSLAGIEKRKRVMKEVFDIRGGDLKLIDQAKKNGFL